MNLSAIQTARPECSTSEWEQRVNLAAALQLPVPLPFYV